MLLWAVGALAAAALTGSRGALAVALAAVALWSGERVFEAADVPHLPFAALWMPGAVLALAWNSRVAAHLVALAALAWWITAAIAPSQSEFTIAPGAALLLGAGLLLGNVPSDRLGSFGVTLSTTEPSPWLGSRPRLPPHLANFASQRGLRRPGRSDAGSPA